MRRLHILAALALVAASLAGLGCGSDCSIGSGDSVTSADEAPRDRHPRKRPLVHVDDEEDAAEVDAVEVDADAFAGPPEATSIHLAFGAPVDADPSDDWLMVKPQYALSYNPTHLGANWVSWELNSAYYGGVTRHKGKFIADDTLPEGWYRVRHDDYSRSDYDRGHMVRSEERTRSREDNESTFLLTNILPQRHELNAGPWLRLEDYCRDLALRGSKELFVTAGPIFGPRPDTIGHGVAVPESFYKIVVVLGHDQGPADVAVDTRVIAVIMPNENGISGEPWEEYRTSVAEIERRTGYRFLGNVPERTREALVGRVDAEP